MSFNMKKDTSVGDFIIVKKLRQAIYGAVFLAIKSSENEEVRVAVKMMDLHSVHNQLAVATNERVGEDALLELKVMKLIEQNGGHPSILRLHQSYEKNGKLFVISEYCAGGEMFSLIDRCGKLSISRCRIHFKELVEGVSYLHSLKISHRDISLENILLHSDGRIRICDFGLASVGGGNNFMVGRAGKNLYMAPEVVDSSSSSEVTYNAYAADVWSLGICLFIMLTGVTVIERAHSSDPRFKYLVNNQLHLLVKHWGLGLSKEICNLLQGMLQPNPARRWSLSQVAAHEFVAGLSPPQSPLLSFVPTLPFVDNNCELALETGGLISTP